MCRYQRWRGSFASLRGLFNCKTARSTDPPSRFALRRGKHASSPPFLVRPGAAGRLLPSFAREGVRNAWAFHRTRGPVCKRVEKTHTSSWRTQLHAGVPHAMSLFGLAASRLWWARSAGTLLTKQPRGAVRMGMHLDPIACTGFAGLIRHGIDTHPPSVQASPAQATIASRPTSRGDLDSPSHRGGTGEEYS
jgi:hypothetical protein